MAAPVTLSVPPLVPVLKARSRPDRTHRQTVVRWAPSAVAMSGVEYRSKIRPQRVQSFCTSLVVQMGTFQGAWANIVRFDLATLGGRGLSRGGPRSHLLPGPYRGTDVPSSPGGR
jgi:hypothetical protein